MRHAVSLFSSALIFSLLASAGWAADRHEFSILNPPGEPTEQRIEPSEQASAVQAEPDTSAVGDASTAANSPSSPQGLATAARARAMVQKVFKPQAASGHEPSSQTPAISHADFDDGVRAYREGDYATAQQHFEVLHKFHPEDTRITYYLAITDAQLGRFKQARALYQEIVTLDPSSEAAALALEGQKYLPAGNGLDLPPKFQAKGQAVAAPANAVPTTAAGTATNPGVFSNGMSMQDMMALQSMMGSGGGNSNGGLNMLPYMMMQQNGDPNSPNAVDPNAMSTMLMNQMMSNFNFNMDSKKDNDQ